LARSTAEAYRQHEHYAIGQALIAAYEQMRQPDLEVDAQRGGAARIRYVTGGGVTDWMHVLRVNQKTLSVLRWSAFSGGSWYEDKIARRDVSEKMSAEGWAAYVAEQAQKGEDGRWQKLLERIK
jgi:cation transport regulator ChaB